MGYKAELSPVDQKLSTLHTPPFFETPSALGAVDLHEYECEEDELQPSSVNPQITRSKPLPGDSRPQEQTQGLDSLKLLPDGLHEFCIDPPTYVPVSREHLGQQPQEGPDFQAPAGRLNGYSIQQVSSTGGSPRRRRRRVHSARSPPSARRVRGRPAGARRVGGRDPRADGRRSRAGEVEDEEDLRRGPLLPAGHSDVSGAPRGQGDPWAAGLRGWNSPSVSKDASLPKAEWQVAEAKILVHTLDSWSVVERMMVSTKVPDRKLDFGKGTLEHLTEKIRALSEVTAVFLIVERMSVPTTKQLEAAWGVQVFNRFTVVLHIFCCNARTKEARLQVALAELPVLRSGLKDRIAPLDGHGGSSRYILGSGELFMQLPQRLMRAQEMKMRKALERLRDKWQLLGCTRDLIVHVRDLSHPETLHKASMLSALHGLCLPAQLLDFVLEVHSKVSLPRVRPCPVLGTEADVWGPCGRGTVETSVGPGLSNSAALHRYRPLEPRALAVSALLGLGLEQLKAPLEDAVLRATGRRVLTLRAWLHEEAMLHGAHVVPEDAAATQPPQQGSSADVCGAVQIRTSRRVPGCSSGQLFLPRPHPPPRRESLRALCTHLHVGVAGPE
ncbi:LOW QUALITY PROTEIN: putative GTP-binding protein 6 [Rhynchonycteris naso]